MGYGASILLDSVSADGCRLTTATITLPKFLSAELVTHRALSRNSASSRAIPTKRLLEMVETDPVMPIWWGKNQSGMQAREELGIHETATVIDEWILARNDALKHARALLDLGAHKQIVNRLVEPWLFTTYIVSATEWANFFALRAHEDAQPELRHVARMLKAAYDASTPEERWIHLPLMPDHDAIYELYSTEDLCRISSARCARVSYLTHDTRKLDTVADLELAKRLQESGHMSPFEHAAVPRAGQHGNFVGWKQYRKFIPGEAVFTNG